MADASISPSTQDLMSQINGRAMSALDDYTNSLATAKPGTNTSGMKKTLAEESATAKQLDQQKIPDAPKLNKDLPDAPTRPHTDPLDVFSQFGPVLAVLGSFAAKGPNHAAIDAATAAMNAKKSGDQEDYENKKSEWEEKTKKMLDQNKMELDEYQAAVESSKGNIGLINAKLSAIAAKFGDQHMLAMVQAGDAGRALDLKEKKLGAVMKMQDAFEKQQRYGGGAGGLSDEAVDMIVEQGIAQGSLKGAMTNLGRGAQGAQDIRRIQNRFAVRAKELGLTGEKLSKMQAQFKELGTEANSEGRMKQAITASANILEKSLPSAMAIARKYQLSESTDLNAIRNFIAAHGSSEDKTNFSTQMRELATSYAMLISRGKNSITVHSDDEALKILHDDMGINSLEGFEKAARQETKNIKAGIKATDDELFGGSSSGVDLHEKYGLEK